MKLNFVCPELSGNGGTETVLVTVLNHLSKYHLSRAIKNCTEMAI